MITKVQIAFALVCTLAGVLTAQVTDSGRIVGVEQALTDSSAVSPMGKLFIDNKTNNQCYGCKIVTTFGSAIAEGLLAAAIASAYGKRDNYRVDMAIAAGLSAGYILGSSLGTVAYGSSRNEKGSIAGSVAGSLAGAFIGGLVIGAGVLTESEMIETMGIVTCFITIPIGSVKGYDRRKK